MITLLQKNYKKTDYDFLYAVIHTGLTHLGDIEICKDKICSTCPYKNGCDDIHRLINYLIENHALTIPTRS